MTRYIVCYDLNKVGQNYECLTTKLKAYRADAWHLQGSVWIVKSDESAIEIRDALMKCLDQNDEILVAPLATGAAWHGQGDDFTAWFKV